MKKQKYHYKKSIMEIEAADREQLLTLKSKQEGDIDYIKSQGLLGTVIGFFVATSAQLVGVFSTTSAKNAMVFINYFFVIVVIFTFLSVMRRLKTSITLKHKIDRRLIHLQERQEFRSIRLHHKYYKK